MMPTKFVAQSMQDFANGVREVSVHSIHHHFIEARLRLKLMSNDFSQWLLEDVGLTETARALNRIDIYTGTLEDVRRQIVRVVERALA
jgi:elongation factor P hydroxylase